MRSYSPDVVRATPVAGTGAIAEAALAVPLPDTDAAEAWREERDRAESLVVQTSFLGDTVLTTPLIAELATRGPVDVVVTPASAQLLANNPFIRHLVVYDKRGERSGVTGLWRTAVEARGRRSPVEQRPRRERRAERTAYLAQGSVRSAVLAILAGVRERIGFATSPGRALYTRRIPFREDRHHAERLWRLAFPDNPSVKLPNDGLRPRLYPSMSDRRAVSGMLREAGVDVPFIALAPGSVWATKRWPHYAALAKRLAPRFSLAVVGGPEDSSLAREIAAAVKPHPIVEATGKLTLLGSAELIARAAAIVTNDSSPQHLASAMGTPTITVFGPTVPEFGFGPLAPRSVVAGHAGLDCRPCHRHGPERCPLGHWRCMRELDVESVERLLTSILG